MPEPHCRRIVLASGNSGKLAEIQRLLQWTQLDIELVPQSELGVEAAAESGLSFVENAILKARHAARHRGLPALADDSGLEVDALDGAPGIRSARFAGSHGDDAANNRHLLRALQQVPELGRSARFRCVMVCLRHPADPAPLIAEGIWEGSILRSPRGDRGFGYDPLFWVRDHHASAAELATEVKNRVSHRGQAVRSLTARLSDHLAAGTQPSHTS